MSRGHLFASDILKTVMGEIVELKRNRPFTLQEAQSLLPLVKRLTQEAVDQVEALKKRIEAVDPEPCHRPFYENQLSLIVEHWSQKILKLGCTPKGLWIVSFDNGEGFYSWHYPEDDVAFLHTYQTGLTGRTPI